MAAVAQAARACPRRRSLRGGLPVAALQGGLGPRLREHARATRIPAGLLAGEAREAARRDRGRILRRSACFRADRLLCSEHGNRRATPPAAPATGSSPPRAPGASPRRAPPATRDPAHAFQRGERGHRPAALRAPAAGRRPDPATILGCREQDHADLVQGAFEQIVAHLPNTGTRGARPGGLGVVVIACHVGLSALRARRRRREGHRSHAGVARAWCRARAAFAGAPTPSAR